MEFILNPILRTYWGLFFVCKKMDKTIEEQSRMLEKLKNDIKEKEEKLKNFVNFSNFRYVFKGIN